MTDEKVRALSKRSTELSQRGEILRRLALLALVFDLALGLGFTIAGLRTHRLVLLAVGAVLLAAALALWLTRRRWGVGQVVDELRRNPFKPERAPKD